MKNVSITSLSVEENSEKKRISESHQAIATVVFVGNTRAPGLLVIANLHITEHN